MRFIIEEYHAEFDIKCESCGYECPDFYRISFDKKKGKSLFKRPMKIKKNRFILCPDCCICFDRTKDVITKEEMSKE